jgi:cytochrome c5
MKKIIVAILSCGMIAAAGFWHQALSSDPEGTMDGEKLFETKCSICHTIERPKSKKKTKAEWETTVMRMKNKNGCPVSDEEAKAIIDYLSEKYGASE